MRDEHPKTTNSQQFCHSNQSTWVLIHSHVGLLENWVRKNLMTYQDILGYNGHSVGIFHFQTNPDVVTAWLVSKHSCTDLYSTYCPYSLIHPMIDHYQPDSMMGYVTIIESIGKTIVDLIIHWRVVTIFTIINHIWVCLKMGISRPSRNWMDLWHPEDKLCLQGMLMMNHLYKMHLKKKCIHPNAFHFLSWNDESSIKARDMYIYIYEYIEIEIINNIYIYTRG